MAPTADSTSSTREASRSADGSHRGVALGVVVGAHGLGGELRVRLSADALANLERAVRVQLAASEEGPVRGSYAVAAVQSARGGECRLTLEGVADREAAERLRGCVVRVSTSDLEGLADGEFYAYELVGCEVVEMDGRSVGRVRSLVEAGGRDLLIVEDATGREQLVPAVEPLLQEVDLEARRIRIDAPPGLLDSGGAGDPGEGE